MANKSKKANANKAGKEVTEEVIQAESKVEETKKPAKRNQKVLQNLKVLNKLNLVRILFSSLLKQN